MTYSVIPLYVSSLRQNLGLKINWSRIETKNRMKMQLIGPTLEMTFLEV